MKVISIGNFEYGWDGSICDEEHIATALEKMGHTVHRLPRTSLQFGLPTPLALPDFILIAQWDGYPPDLIDQLRKKYPCIVVYWAFDYQEYGQEWHERLVKECDLYLSKRLSDSKYLNWHWLSQDFSPPFLHDFNNGNSTRPPIEKDIDVLFTGTYLPWATERNETLKAVDDKFGLTIHSVNPEAWLEAGFKNVHGPVMDEQLPHLIARAKINLSIDHTLDAGYWSDRNAQIMACGGFVLFRYVPLSEAVFKHYISYFFSTASCLQRIEYFLQNPEQRDIQASNGYRYAHENLMVQNRVMEFFLILGSIIA